MSNKGDYIAQLKSVFQRFYGSPMNIWEETVINTLPEEFEANMEFMCTQAHRIIDVLELHKARMGDEVHMQDIQQIGEWAKEQEQKHVLRLFQLAKFVNLAVMTIVRVTKSQF